MQIRIYILLLLLGSMNLFSQVSNTGNNDTIGSNRIGKISIGCYIDTYYGFNFSKTSDQTVPYFVSMNRNNEANINLALVDLRFQAVRLRARFAPGFGSYNNANYSTEPGLLKNIIEANIGVKPFKKHDIWVDFGVLGSPFTNESCISKDHFVYSRSLAPEYVPYYLSGAKVSIPISKKWILYLYLLNGWQQIVDLNKQKSFATQVEYRPNNKNLINWNVYVGDERKATEPNNRMRYFSDIYWIFNPDGKISLTSCAYIGIQNRVDILNNKSSHLWWQANILARFKLNKNLNLSGRLEYFNDSDQVQIINLVDPNNGFQAFSGSLCMNLNLFGNAMLRIEGRQFYSMKESFTNLSGSNTRFNTWLISNLTVWF